MSKISYEIFGNTGELSGYSRDGGDITFTFVGAEGTHFSLSGHSYEVTDCRVSIPKEKIKDGIHIPRLHTKKGQVILPLIEFDGNKISFPQSEDISHSLSLRLARLTAKITALEKELSELNSYVRGSSCF